jgi:hypothetical protein
MQFFGPTAMAAGLSSPWNGESYRRSQTRSPARLYLMSVKSQPTLKSAIEPPAAMTLPA